jgi:hypothetical protein
MHFKNNLEQEIKGFSNLWKGGYYEGNPLDPMGKSNYGVLGYISSLYALYLTCIKPYINESSVVCEIGCGRGAWTKTFLGAKEIWCLDALSAEYNNFWEYVGNQAHIHYIQVDDFSCRALPDNKIDYLFSFGCLCHISFEGISEYMKNMHAKLRDGAHGFIMVADYDKFNQATKNIEKYLCNVLPPMLIPILKLYYSAKYLLKGNSHLRDKNESGGIIPGRWYHAGIDRTCTMLESLSYKIIDNDVNINIRDPLIHFIKS